MEPKLVVCNAHSGIKTDVNNIKQELLEHQKTIKRMDAKLNMIIGAIVLSPFIWTLLIGLMKFHL